MGEVGGSKRNPERVARLYRDISLGTAAVELAGLVLVPEAAPLLVPLIALNIASAGLAEFVRRARSRKATPQPA